RGHFYNWYDTRTLAPLPPPYISTVDSGNLAGYLLTLRAGLLDLAEARPIIEPSVLEGLEDVVDLVEQELGDAVRGAAAAGRWTQQLQEVRAALVERPGTIAQWRALLVKLGGRLASLGVLLHELDEPDQAKSEEASPRTPAIEAAGYWLDKGANVVATR